MAGFVDDVAPGSGRRAPRADFVSDAATLSLNGTWRFRLSPTAAGTGSRFIDDDCDDREWDPIRVPAHWVLEGHDRPLYTNTAFPFPIDPPRLPLENPTGDYRLRFSLPADWADGRSVLRFHGVDSCGTVWLNGTLLGHSKGSRLPFEFDVTDALRPGSNLLAVRVNRWSSGSYLEDQDMWWLPGIFRDVELLARPAGAIDDYFVHADFDHTDGSGALRVDSDVPGFVELPELGVRVATGETVRVERVDPWSAEVPRLYRGTLTAGDSMTPAETIELAVGFRTVTISDGRLLINGAPVLFRGVNRHEHDPDRGRSLDRATMVRDIVMMKQHNINAVRTSHYPPHPEFLRLCDEYGLWVVEECDIETHGFIYAGWEGNPPAEPMWRDALMDRIQRMVERDKNRPSVVIWSIANESWTGETFNELERWIRERDSSRPIHYERDPSYRNSDFYSLMYPSLDDLEQIGRREEKTPDLVTAGSADDKRRRTLPFLLCEYAHAMGNGPGSLADYQRIIENHDRFCGAFVWEWIDHGFRATADDGSEYFMHGGDVDYTPNGGTYCIDGLVFPDRTPSPGLAEYAAVIAPIEFSIDVASRSLTVRNKYDARDLTHVTLAWRLESDGVLIDAGSILLPTCGARSSVTVALPDAALGSDADAGSGERWLTVSAALTEAAPWAPAGHEIAWGQSLIAAASRPAERTRTSLAGAVRDAETIRLGPAVFDAASGLLLRLGSVAVDGPVLDVWRAPIENDHGQGGVNDVERTWRAVGLDRVIHRTDAVEIDGARLVVTGRTAAAGQAMGLATVFEWELVDDALALTVTVEPDGVWEKTMVGNHTVTLPRLGVRMALPDGYDGVEWFGRGPGESYVDSVAAARIGRFRSSIDALQTPYVVPQENGNHVETRMLELSGSALPTVRVTGDPTFAFTARRWRSEDLDAAAHPYELRDTGRVWLNLDHAQRGIGSAACGPALPGRYDVPVASATFRLAFSLLAR